jgi:hypothetical protein
MENRTRPDRQRGAAVCPPENNGLLTQKSLDDYASLLERALSCFRQGEYERAIEINNSLLHSNKIPLELLAQIIENRDLSLEALYPKVRNPSRHANKIIVCVPFHNPGQQLANCVNSLLYQDYQNFQIVFIDDGSSDESYRHIPTTDARVTLIRNETRQGWASCLHACVTQYCEPEDIVFPLGGTRRLSYCDALLTVNEFFNDYACTAMYGQHNYSTGQLGLTVPVTGTSTLQALKEAGHAPIPFIFRGSLYRELIAEDTPLSLRTKQPEEWPDDVAESALSYALLEKCGLHKARFSSHLLATIQLSS